MKAQPEYGWDLVFVFSFLLVMALGYVAIRLYGHLVERHQENKRARARAKFRITPSTFDRSKLTCRPKYDPRPGNLSGRKK